MLEIIKDDKVVQRSKNLRGLLERAHKIGVAKAAVIRSGNGANVYVTFSDGSECWTSFADFTIARDFFRKRWQKWGLYAEVRNSDDFWSFI
jgi:hypothetical protein